MSRPRQLPPRVQARLDSAEDVASTHPSTASIETGLAPSEVPIGTVDEKIRKLLVKAHELKRDAHKAIAELKTLSDPTLIEEKTEEADLLIMEANILKEDFWFCVFHQFPGLTRKRVSLRDDWILVVQTQVPVLVINFGDMDPSDTSDDLGEIPDRSRMN